MTETINITTEKTQSTAKLKTMHSTFCIAILVMIFCVLSLLFAVQYNPECQNSIETHLLDFFKEILSFIHNIVKDFSFAFLILLLCSVSCLKNFVLQILNLADNIFEKGFHIDVEISEQTKQDKQEIKQQEEIENSLTLNNNSTKNATRERVQKQDLMRKTLIKILDAKTETTYKESYKMNRKLTMHKDAVVQSVSLLFHHQYNKTSGETVFTRYTYDYKSLIISDNIYKYVRVINDINYVNIKYIFEIILITRNPECETGAFEQLCDMYKKAINRGILVIKQYKLADDKPVLVHSTEETD